MNLIFVNHNYEVKNASMVFIYYIQDVIEASVLAFPCSIYFGGLQARGLFFFGVIYLHGIHSCLWFWSSFSLMFQRRLLATAKTVGYPISLICHKKLLQLIDFPL